MQQGTLKDSPKVTKKAKRRFSKFIVCASLILSWVIAFISVYEGQSNVATTALGLIFVIVGSYMGIGHLDFRTASKIFKTSDSYDMYSYKEEDSNYKGPEI